MNDTTDAPTTADPRALEGTLPDGDPRLPFAKAVAVAGGVLDGVRADQLELPTPCHTMDVRALRRHLVMVLQRVAAAGRGLPLQEWPGDNELPDEAIATEWDAAAHDIQAVWTDETILGRPTDLPWTTISGAETLAIYTNEVVVHTWDLATATGQHATWDDEVLAVSEAAIHAQLPEADRRPMWDAMVDQMPPGIPWEDPFANATEVSADASAIERLVAWNGRQV